MLRVEKRMFVIFYQTCLYKGNYYHIKKEEYL